MPLFKQLCGLQVAGGALPAAGRRHGVVAPLAQGITPGNAPCAQQNAFYTAVGQDGLHGVVAAAGRKPAAAANPWAEGVLVDADGHAQRPAAEHFAAGVTRGTPAFAFALRAGGTVAGGFASGRLALSGRPAWANSFATTLLSCQLFSLRGHAPGHEDQIVAADIVSPDARQWPPSSRGGRGCAARRGRSFWWRSGPRGSCCRGS